MKSFFRSLLATITGIIISFILLFLIFFGIVGAIMSSQDKPVEVKDNSVLYLKLNRPITDRAPVMPFNLQTLSKDDRLGLNEILENIAKAKVDDKISGIYIELGPDFAGLATTQEIRAALLDFRESGKFVVSYANSIFMQKSYFLATASDKIFMNPVGMLIVNGFALQTQHLKNTLKKLEIEATVLKIKEYKSFGEIFEYDKMSKADREQRERLAVTMWDVMASDISESRDISLDKFNTIVNTLSIKDPQSAIDYGLLDSLIYKGDVINYLKDLTNTADKDDINTVKLSSYNKVPKQKAYKGLAKDKIAVIYASGGIVDGEGDENNIGGAKYARAIRLARRDSSIKAIVLRVNSGGGSAMASEDILVELLETKGVKPIVVSMGDVAASGGYYIACAADSLIANESTITGSIGIIWTYFNTKGFFNNKLGITFDVAKSHQYADLLTGIKPLNLREKELITHYLNITYDQFITHVATGRGISKERVNEIGRGHVYSGPDALGINLIDSYGGLTKAIDIAHDLANLDEKYRVIELPKQPDPIEQFIKEITGEAKVKSVLDVFGIDTRTYYEIKNIVQTQGAVARIPYIISN